MKLLDLKYSLVIEATEKPDFLAFYFPDLQGFTGVWYSIEDCIYKARWGMAEHLSVLNEGALPILPTNPDQTIIIQNAQRIAEAA